MRILVTGANGFIGGHVVAALLKAGHEVVGAVRDPEAWRRRWPRCAAVACDFNRDTAPEAWAPRLSGIDAAINAAGILTARGGQSQDRVHVAAPRALFEACRAAGIRRVVHISALGADAEAGTDYARTKKAAEDALMALDLDWVILRPSLVYGGTSYGGTSLLRGLAALPGIVPVVGEGGQPFCPLHMDDLTAAIVRLIEPGAPAQLRLDAPGPEIKTLLQIQLGLRHWLGLKPGKPVKAPVWAIGLASKMGDVLGWPTVNSTSFAMMRHGNTAPSGPFARVLGAPPRDFAAGLKSQPAGTQDRWHARLYFLRPLVRWSLALVWLASGLLGFSTTAIALGVAILAQAGIGDGPGAALLYAFAAVDLAIGAALLLRWRVAAVGWFSAAVVIGYTAVLTILAAPYWLDPLGPVLKNLPFLAATLVMIALDDER